MTKTTEENLSQSKYAEHRNVTKGYISRMVKEGRLHLIKGKLNVAMSDAELDNKSNNDKAPNYWVEKALHEKAKRELAELDLKLKSGKYNLARAPFQKGWQDAISNPRIHTIVGMTSAQVGKTETFLNNPVGYFIFISKINSRLFTGFFPRPKRSIKSI